jgi:uncharacterized protein YndB with AHSA1/START domain
MAVSRVAANSDTFQMSTPSDREVQLTRLFDAPRALVFEALTKPEHIRRWWGILSDKHSVPVCEMDARPGGKWRFVGRGPEGDYPAFYGECREVVPPERIVYTEIFEGFPTEESLVTAVLAEENGRTRLTVTSTFSSIDVRDMVINTGMAGGAATSYDRLEDLVGELQRGR